MANTYKSLNELFAAIANAIRAKKQSTDPIVADDFPAEIEGIETEPVLQDKTITPTTEVQTVTADEGYDGLGIVTVEAGRNSPEAELALTLWAERAASNDLRFMFYHCASLTTVPLFDTSNATNTQAMFWYCRSLTTVPLFDTSNVFDVQSMFWYCTSLTTVPQFNTGKVTNMYNMFAYCRSLTTVPQFNTEKVTSMNGMFKNCTALTTVPQFNTGKVTAMTNMFENCTSLTDCYLRNIKANLQVGSGTSYGHLLTLDSLIHLIKECRDTGSQKTLTVSTVSLEKLTNVYVRTIEITDAMRAEDDLIDEKHPFEVCESTDEGAMLIVDYAATKNWLVQGA